VHVACHPHELLLGECQFKAGGGCSGEISNPPGMAEREDRLDISEIG